MSTPEQDEPEGGKPAAPPPLSRNMISYLGWAVTLIGAILTAVLIAADYLFHSTSQYNAVVTYLMMPGVLGGGVSLILLGVLLEWRRRHRKDPGQYPVLPTLDMNLAWQRRRVLVGISFLTIFFSTSAVGVYQSYHYTESREFCGLVCHSVMKPEYTAYQHSPHARVLCVECHIGSGAEWYVKSKMSGLRQVVAMVRQNYHLPIDTPVKNLRPARDTCEECHWPGKFSNSKEREIWHFSPDQSNTPMRYNLLMKVGGGEPEVGKGHGIHWHINKAVKVRYYATDEDRLDIPWVEVTVDGGKPRVFASPEFAGKEPPAGAELREMDCIDCHNRPSHIYLSPRQLVDSSLESGQLDTSLPFVRRIATQLLEQAYESTPAAMAAIEKTMNQSYESRMEGPKGKELVKNNTAWLQEIYSRNFFPEQKVDWRQYPNHLGHFEFPGCFRCHDGKHQETGGATISADCNLCHDMIDQAEGQAAHAPAEYHAAPFKHPRNMGDIWLGRSCTDCHGIETEKDHATVSKNNES